MNKDLKLLIQIWLSEELHEETERLLEKLKNEEEFRLAFIDEVLMMGKVKAVNLSEPKFAILEEILNDQPESNVKYEEKIFQSLEKEDRQKKVIKFVLALAAIAAFIIFLNLPKESSVPEVVEGVPKEKETLTETLAIISSQSNAKWANEKYESQKNLYKEELHLLEGTARIDFVFGASLVMNAGTKITIQELDKIYLHEGLVSCEVNEFGRGFIINTEESEIVDLGTAFQVEAGKGKDTKVHVLEGEVKVRPNNIKESKSIFKSEAVTVTSDKLMSIEFSGENLVTLDAYEDKLEKSRNEKLKKWMDFNEQLDANPNTVFHLVKSEKSLIQLRKDISGSEVQAAYNFGSSNERGRWLTNGALSYSKKYDRTLVRLKNEHESFTLMTWVKFNNLNSNQNALMCFEMPTRWLKSIGTTLQRSREKNSKGDFHAMRWMVTRDGRPSLGVAYYGEKPNATSLEWHRFQVPTRKISRKSMGNWLFLAVTVDSKKLKLTHYFNGRKVSVHDMPKALSANLEFLEIGNLTRPGKNEDKGMSIRLNGSIDEMLIKNRALSLKEIRELYQTGNP